MIEPDPAQGGYRSRRSRDRTHWLYVGVIVAVVAGVVVPAAYEYSSPPVSGLPLSSKN
jgi:hypothetical protein